MIYDERVREREREGGDFKIVILKCYIAKKINFTKSNINIQLRQIIQHLEFRNEIKGLRDEQLQITIITIVG